MTKKEEYITKAWGMEKIIAGLIALLVIASGFSLYILKQGVPLAISYISEIKGEIKEVSNKLTMVVERIDERIETIQYNQTAGGYKVAQELEKLKASDQLLEQRTARNELEIEKLKEKK